MFTAAPAWYELTCEPIKWFDGWLGIYETRALADAAAKKAKSSNRLLEGFRINEISCLPPGDYYIGDLGLVCDDILDLYDFSLEVTGNTFELPNGSILAYFSSGDGIWRDLVGGEYCVDTGCLGALPRRELGEYADNYTLRSFRSPAKCCFYPFRTECIQIGTHYLFPGHIDGPTPEEKGRLSENAYKHGRSLDEILASLSSLTDLHIESSRSSASPVSDDSSLPLRGNAFDTFVSTNENDRGISLSLVNQSRISDFVDWASGERHRIPERYAPGLLSSRLDIGALSLSRRSFDVLTSQGFLGVNELAFMWVNDYREMKRMGSVGPDEIVDAVESLGIAYEVNSSRKAIFELCPTFLETQLARASELLDDAGRLPIFDEECDLKIEELGLSVRACNILKCAGHNRLTDLSGLAICKFWYGPEYRNLGTPGAESILRALLNKGLIEKSIVDRLIQ